MTGTGTQNDPYIVSTWPDFVTAVGTTGSYVEVVPGTVWDANDIAPEGMPTVNVNATHVDGKGLEIKNARIDRNFLDCLSTTASGITVENISITNFLASSSVIYKRGNYSLYFKNFVLSGIQTSGNTIYHYAGGSVYFNSNADSGCGFKVNCRGGSLFGGSYSYQISDTIFSLSGGSVGVNTAQCGQLINCYIEGECSTVYALNSSRNTVVNCAAQTVNVKGTNMLVNSDKCSNITNGTAVTDEQLRDPAYLASIGFPIGGET